MSNSRKTSGRSQSSGGSVELVLTRSGPLSRAVHGDRQVASVVRVAERLGAKLARRSRAAAPCIHLGDPTGGADAYGPRGVACLKLYACALHGQCSLARVAPGVPCCASCGTYAPA